MARSCEFDPKIRSQFVPVHDLARLAVAALVREVCRRRLPLRRQVEQVDEEVVRQRAGPLREDAVLRAAGVCAEHAQAADERSHLRRAQREQLRAIEQALLGRARVIAPEVVAEAVGRRFEHRERMRVGLILRRVGAARREAAPSRRARRLLAACSIAALPPSTMTSASDTFLPPESEALKSACDLLERLQHLRQFRGLIDGPVFLRCEANARAVRAAALIGAAERRGRRPRGRHQLRDRQAGGEDRALERGDVLIVDQRMIDRRHRVLPDPFRPALRGRDSARSDPCRGA